MPPQEAQHIARRRILGGEERIAELLFEIAVQVEVGSARIDQHASRIVVNEERHVHALPGHLDPLFILAALFVLPHERAVVVAGARCDGCNHGVRTDGEAADFNHSHRGAANLRERSIENQPPALQQLKSIEEKADAGAEADAAPEEQSGGVRRAKDQNREAHRRSPRGGWDPLPIVSLTNGQAAGSRKSRAALTLVMRPGRAASHPRICLSFSRELAK